MSGVNMIIRCIYSYSSKRTTQLYRMRSPKLPFFRLRQDQHCRRFMGTAQPNEVNIVIRTVRAVRGNITGYTKVLLSVMGMMTVVILIAEATIANQSIILNVIPPEPSHPVVTYSEDVFEPLRTPKQLIRPKTRLLNLYGPHGSGKTELLRQYCIDFISKGPHLYYKINKISNRRMCQVFFVDCSSPQTMKHSLEYLTRKLKVVRSEEGSSDVHSFIRNINEGLRKLSRWSLVFENVPASFNVAELFQGVEENWGDGQIILTSESPVSNCHKNIAVTSILPSNIHEDIYNAIAPNESDIHDLKDLFHNDLRSYIMHANCALIEQEQGIAFDSNSLYRGLNSSSEPSKTMAKYYSALKSLISPKLLLAIDFLSRMQCSRPVPYDYVKQHMNHSLYINLMENVLNYCEYRRQELPKYAALIDNPKVESQSVTLSVNPDSLPLVKRYHHRLSLYLGLDPTRPWIDQFKELYELVYPRPSSPQPEAEYTLLTECPFIKVNPSYGGHVSTVAIDADLIDTLRELHSEFTVPLLESAVVLDKKRKYGKTWISSLRSFNPQTHLLETRKKILGKDRVHLDPNHPKPDEESVYPVSRDIYNNILIYKTSPASHKNLREYESLLYKQILKSVMSYLDVTQPNTVKGTLQTILMQQTLSYLRKSLESSYSNLAYSCELYMMAQLGLPDLEHQFIASLDEAKQCDRKGPSHASALHRYAIWLYQNSRNQEAKDLLIEASKFADSISLCRSLALVLCELEEYEAAEGYLDKSLRQINPGAHDVLGPLLIDLGQVLLLRGKTVLGIQCLQKAIDGYKTVVGTNDPEYARALSVVSIGHLILGDAERSRRARAESSTVITDLKKKGLLQSQPVL